MRPIFPYLSLNKDSQIQRRLLPWRHRLYHHIQSPHSQMTGRLYHQESTLPNDRLLSKFFHGQLFHWLCFDNHFGLISLFFRCR